MTTPLRLLLRREALALGLAASVGGHLAIAHAIPTQATTPTPSRRPPADFVEVVAPPAAKPTPPRPEPALPERAEEGHVAVTDTAPIPNPAPPVRPSPEAPTREAAPPQQPLALTGVTLSGGDTGWQSPLGNGERITGPIGTATTRTPAAPVAPRPTHGARAPEPPPRPRDVALADLSEKPRAPNLNGSLRRLYPPAAREQEVSGHAAVRVRVGPNGAVTTTRLVAESFAGFGAACQAALQGSTWSSPRDRDGRAVSTWLLYRCNFALQR